MTNAAKQLISDLLTGGYLRPWKRPSGAKCHRLYSREGNPVKNVMTKTVEKMQRCIDPKLKILKQSKEGKITLHLSNVRQLHGNSCFKKMYKKTIANGAHAQS